MDPTESEKEAVPGAVANSGPPEATQETAASSPTSVDPIAVGGAVGGMTVGEVVGGAIGGVIGAVAGPGGAAIGAGLGAFAGTSIGAKLGYDVTHELVHPEDVDPNASLKERAQEVARSTAGRAGDAVGGGIGAAGGALVGTVLAGPLGGAVGSFVGEAIAGELGEERAADLYARVEHRAENVEEAKPAPEAKTETDHPSATKWLANVASETAGETGLAAMLGAVGGLVADNPGRTLGRRAGTVVAKHLKWSFPFPWKRKNPTETQAVADKTESPPESTSPDRRRD
ncbi:MAG: hypothetical protein ABSH35_29785 [Isosphaeraceae bacterium]